MDHSFDLESVTEQHKDAKPAGDKQGVKVVFGNLGKLSAAKRDAREARNPSTGAIIQVPAKTVVKFKPAKALSDAVA